MPSTNLRGPVLNKFPLRRRQRQFLVGILENQAIAFRHFCAGNSKRSGSSVRQPCLYPPVITNLASVKRSAEPHIVVVTTRQAFVKPPGLNDVRLTRDHGRDWDLATLHHQRLKTCLASRRALCHKFDTSGWISYKNRI